MKKTLTVVALFAAVSVFGASFKEAIPVWPVGQAQTPNLMVGFKSRFNATDGEKAILRVTGSAVYRVTLNGKYVGYGPARAAIGCFRVDEWPLDSALVSGHNELLVECASYNVNNFYYPDQSAFLQAEVVAGGRVVAATAPNGSFKAAILPRVQKTARYSFQRGFSEAYDLTQPKVGPWPGIPDFSKEVALEARPEVKLLPRIAPYPDFKVSGNFSPLTVAPVRFENVKVGMPRFMIPSPKFKAFKLEELAFNGWEQVNRMRFGERKRVEKTENGRYQVADGHAMVFDGGFNDTGFIGLEVLAKKPCRVAVTFDEILDKTGAVDAKRMECVNIVVWNIAKPGVYRLETFEPYTARFVQVASFGGEVEISAPTMRGYKNPTAFKAALKTSDAALDSVFAAARETFAQNAVDVFSDCPSRERAGWLCDSFFIGRVNALLCGDTTQEKLFLENYAMAEKFKSLPDGMVAMCYPADHSDGGYIPNWAMWLILEADEYLVRSGDRATIDALKPKFEGIVNFLWRCRNKDGLLEKLPGWVFVEWSHANKCVQDVNYPSNMAWAEVLDAMSRLYSRADLAEEAARVRAEVRRQSWDGEWFRDHAVRDKEGKLVLCEDRTETCQYYAFFFGTATEKSHPELWKRLLGEFGPQRKKTRAYPEIHASNAFIGNYLRLELLSRAGLREKILEEVKGYFCYMVERTGTLWEHDSTSASCCHGFASHVAVLIVRDILGIEKIDLVKREVTMKEVDIDLKDVELSLPLPNGMLKFVKRDGAKPCISVPDGWRVIK